MMAKPYNIWHLYIFSIHINEDKNMEKRIYCLFLAVVLFLTGCVNGQNSQMQQNANFSPVTKEQMVEATYMVEQPVLLGESTYEMPVSMVRAMVDRNGYMPDREKYVLFA